MNEEDLYAQVIKELNDDGPRKGLWAQSFAEAEGNENKAKALYIKYRVAQLKSIKEQEKSRAKIANLPAILLILGLVVLVIFTLKFQADEEKARKETIAREQEEQSLQWQEEAIANSIKIYPFSDNIRVELIEPYTDVKTRHFLTIPKIELSVYQANSNEIIAAIDKNKAILQNLILKDLSKLSYDQLYGVNKDEVITGVIRERLVMENIQSTWSNYAVGGISEVSLPQSFLIE